jgi:trans-aconitate methyltransferase
MFDTAAPTYTQFSTVQQHLFDTVMPTYPETDPAHILDIGCGTGINTLKLHQRYPIATLTGLDQSPAMIQEAQTLHSGITWTIGNADTYTHPTPVDFISSHGSLQWVNGPIAPIMARNLAPNGRFNLHMFGPETYTELNQVLRMGWPDHAPIPATRFRTADDYANDLANRWGRVVLSHTRLTVAYASMTALLKAIKHTGTAMPTGMRIWTPSRLGALDALYHRLFGGIWATYTLISIRNYD